MALRASVKVKTQKAQINRTGSVTANQSSKTLSMTLLDVCSTFEPWCKRSFLPLLTHWYLSFGVTASRLFEFCLCWLVAASQPSGIGIDCVCMVPLFLSSVDVCNSWWPECFELKGLVQSSLTIRFWRFEFWELSSTPESISDHWVFPALLDSIFTG